jgi:cation transport ATPase
MAVWAALGEAARHGVLFRNGEALERLAGVRVFLFDKTGTLTMSDPIVAEFAASPGTDATEVLRSAACLASSSTHSYSIAIRSYAEAGSSETPSFAIELSATSYQLSAQNETRSLQTAVEDSRVRTLPGRGLVAPLPGRAGEMALGSVNLMEQQDLAWEGNLMAIRDKALSTGHSLSCIGWDGTVRGVFVFREQLRPRAAEVLAQLGARGFHVAILTGDNAARGAAVSRELGVPVRAELLPEAKVAAVEEARRDHGAVAMVGDGINDAPALAACDVGIALGCGADMARDSALVCLPGDDLATVPWAANLARRTVRVVHQNLFWAFAYNAAGIGLACTGRLNPVLAALAMTLSSFLVVTNSLRLGGPAQRPADNTFSPRLGGQES